MKVTDDEAGGPSGGRGDAPSSTAAGSSSAAPQASAQDAGTGTPAKREEHPLRAGVLLGEETDPVKGVQIFPGVSAEDHNARQAARRKRQSEEF